MDPTVDVLTIYPAAWAALFSGLAEGLIFGLVSVTTAALSVTVLTVILGSLATRADDDPHPIALASLTRKPAGEQRGVVVDLALVRERRLAERLRA